MTSLQFTQAQGLGYTRGMYGVPLSLHLLVDVEHCGGEPEQADIGILYY